MPSNDIRNGSDDIVGGAMWGQAAGLSSGINLQLLDSLPDYVTITAADGSIQVMNANCRRLMGISDFASVSGKVFTDLWPDENKEQLSSAFEAVRGGSSARFTAQCAWASGQRLSWDIACSSLNDDAGKVAHIVAILRDVTDRTALSETLQLSEQKLEAIANNIAQLAWMADPAGDVFWFNQRWYEFTGTGPEVMIGQGWRSVHHPDHIDRVVEKWTRSTAAQTVWEDLFPLRGADGIYRWFLSRAMPVRNSSGEIAFWCGTNTDVTDQRTQSQRLRQLARIIEISREAILVREIGGGILLWNRGCQELYGYPSSTAIGSSSFELLKPRNIKERADFDADILTRGSWSGEILYTASDGSDAWVESRQELIRNGGRNLVLETSRDISERRRADEIRNLLVGELNHRVKNTLAIVQSIATQTARSSPQPDKFVQSFNGRLQSLASAHNVLTDAFWSGAPIGELVKSQLSVAGADISHISIEGPPLFVPPQTALQLTLILHELATNAKTHGALSRPSGRVAISWTVVEGEQRRVDLTWRETDGPAVSPPAARGFGLTLIERSSALPNLNARLEFNPEGIVAKVSAELLASDPQSELFNPGRELTKPRHLVSLPAQDDRKRVMIMDRSFNAAIYLEDLIENAGHVTIGPISTANGALAELDHQPIDLVVADADEIAEAELSVVLSALEQKRIPAIAVGAPETLARIAGNGIARIIPKPIDRPMFLAAVSSALLTQAGL